MSRTTDFLIGLQEGTLTEREKLLWNPQPMLAEFSPLFKAIGEYRRAEGILNGIHSNNPRCLDVFLSHYHGNEGALISIIDARYAKCLNLAAKLAAYYQTLGESTSPETLLKHLIDHRAPIEHKLKTFKKQNRVPHLTALGLA